MKPLTKQILVTSAIGALSPVVIYTAVVVRGNALVSVLGDAFFFGMLGLSIGTCFWIGLVESSHALVDRMLKATEETEAENEKLRMELDETERRDSKDWN